MEFIGIQLTALYILIELICVYMCVLFEIVRGTFITSRLFINSINTNRFRLTTNQGSHKNEQFK